MNPSGYDGTHVVTAANTNSVSFANTTTGFTSGGTVQADKWRNVTLPTGDVNITYDPNANTLTSTIQPSKIVNSMVSATAGIEQSKLAMTAASTRANATGITQADRGLASFDSANFTATSGWIGIKANSITRAQMATIGADAILGNTSNVAANPAEVSTGKIVSDGNGIKNSAFTTASNPASPVGAMILVSTADATTGSGVTNTGAANTYAVLPITTNGGANSLVKTDASGNIDVKQLKIDGSKIIDTTTSPNAVVFTTPGGFDYMSVTGTTGSNTGITTYGTLDVTNGTLKTTTLTTGAAATAGTITGTWQVQSSSTLDVTPGTLKTNTITTGSDTLAGTIQGAWTLVGSSKLQATYADLAEYYSASAEYEPGTVLVFGGDAEVTTTTLRDDTRVAGIVTTDPAYIMNEGLEGTRVCIALAGRVPCKVVGRVKKGDLLTTAASAGYAVKAMDPKLGSIIGKALEDKDYGEAGVIEVAVGRM